MSSAAVDVAVKLTLTDTASAGIAKAAQKAGADAAQVAEKSASLANKYGQKERDAYGKTAEARKLLGVRAEKTIQNEINRTEAAYKRLAASGLASAGEQERAYAAMQRRVTSLTNEMGRMTSEQKKQLEYAKQQEKFTKVQNGFKGAAAGVAGGVAAYYVAKGAMDKPVDYDTRLREATATAYGGGDAMALRSGLMKVKDLVNGTVRNVSGATRDDTLAAYQKLIGGGSFSADESAKLLPAIMKTAVAGRANPTDLVAAAEKIRVGGVKTEDIPTALAKIFRSGQLGGFEIKDSAKWIGQLQPYMKGYKPMEAIEHISTMLQQVRSTSGTNDEAANNLRNFLQKMNAPTTAADFKKYGVDLNKNMAAGLARGETPVQTYMAEIDKLIARADPSGKAKAAMKGIDPNLDPEERKARYDLIKERFSNTTVTKIINDMQEFGGYSGLVKGVQLEKDRGVNTLQSVRDEKGSAVGTSYDFMTEGLGAKFTNLENRKDIAMSDALSGKEGAIGKAIDGITQVADKFPQTAAAATGATVALTALSAATGVAALGLALMGGGGKTGIITKLATAFPSLAAGATLLKGAVAPVAVGAAAGTAGYLAGGSVVGKLDKWLAPKGFDSMADWFVGNKQNQPKPEMQANIQVSVSDDRVSVKSAQVTGQGVDASLSANTGNIWQGAM